MVQRVEVYEDLLSKRFRYVWSLPGSDLAQDLLAVNFPIFEDSVLWLVTL